ncbi:RNA polymerase sigma factor sigC [Glycine max]|nr:RNA polymerase sigma factor sigC [Glycine max]
MGVGFALNPRLRYCVSLHTPHSFTNSPLCLSSPSGPGVRETCFNSTRLSLPSTFYEEGEVLQNSHFQETFADYEALRLEKAIILQLEKLGALKLFNVCLSRSLGTSPVSDYADKVNDYKDKVVVQSRKRKENKTRRENLLPRQFHPTNQEDLLGFSASVVKRVPNTKNKRIIVAKREAEISKGLKVLAELEKIRTAIEEDTKQVASLSNGAEASGVDEKVLQQLLHHGYYCRDELIQSTHSLVLYLARKYMGMGIALDDLLQAGYVGVLQGAGRFDSSRGYKFSTYVQYWIRKSILRVVARYARGIVIPIQKARKAMKCMHKKCPDDYEIAKMTGLSLDKIKSASNCLRIVASLDQKVGNHLGVEYMVRL